MFCLTLVNAVPRRVRRNLIKQAIEVRQNQRTADSSSSSDDYDYWKIPLLLPKHLKNIQFPWNQINLKLVLVLAPAFIV